MSYPSLVLDDLGKAQTVTNVELTSSPNISSLTLPVVHVQVGPSLIPPTSISHPSLDPSLLDVADVSSVLS
jgi:hypothetical protein